MYSGDTIFKYQQNMSSKIPNICVFEQIKFLFEKANSISPIYKSKKIDLFWRIGEMIHKYQMDKKEIATLANWFSSFLDNPPTFIFLEELFHFYKYYPLKERLYFELTWSHYQQLIKVEHKIERDFYAFHSTKEAWTVLQLRRQIRTHYFDRLLCSNSKDAEVPLIIKKPTDVLKQNYLLEFLSINQHGFLEKDLEDALIQDLKNFLLELGSGFAFVDRQKRIVAPTGKGFYIDLVFYNYLLKRFILIDLKTGTLAHQDIGQMDMYVRIVDEKWRRPTDLPTIGLLLCGQLEETIVRYSALHDSKQLYAAAYALEQPSKENLAIDKKNKQWLQELLEKKT